MNTPNQPLPSGINPTGATGLNATQLLQTRAEITDRKAWLERLLANEDVQRYFKDVITPRLVETENQATDINRHEAARRDLWAQCHFELRNMLLWPERELAKLNEALKQIDEKQRKV